MSPIQAYYARPEGISDAGAHKPSLQLMPCEVRDLVLLVQGLVLHERHAASLGIELTHSARSESHIRRSELMIDAILLKDGAPLNTSRPVGSRLVGVCRHFAVMLATLLRAQDIPSRVRCGFATYLTSGKFDDHWICEYWDDPQSRWVKVDAQPRRRPGDKNVDRVDVFDVSKDAFLSAGQAWKLIRSGLEDDSAFGVFDLRGRWTVAAALIRDVAALNKHEMLAWDAWGAMTRPETALQTEQLEFLDKLAQLSEDPDSNFLALRSMYETDARIRVPSSVFNTILEREEPVR